MAREVGAKVFVGLARGEVARAGARWLRGRRRARTVADLARRCGVLADGAADAEVEGVDELRPSFLIFLPSRPMSAIQCWPQAVGAAGDVQLDLLIEAGEALFQFSTSQRVKPLVSAMASLQNSVPVQAMAPRQKG